MRNRFHLLTMTTFMAMGLLYVLFERSAIAADNASATTIPLSVKVVESWTVVESPNFRCHCKLSDSDARQLARSCEVWRQRLRKIWLNTEDSTAWTPKCDVCIHPDQAGYNWTLNRNGDTSVGTTRMNFDQGRAVMRRIDVRADAVDWSNAALPHELTHIVLGDRFGGHALPRWADEGIAMLSESPEKQRDRLNNLKELLSKRQTMVVDDLLRTQRLPAPHLRDAFYGQSIALTSMLVRRSSPAQFADFIETSRTDGIQIALHQHYKLSGVQELKTEWEKLTNRPESMEFVSLQMHDGLAPILLALRDNRQQITE